MAGQHVDSGDAKPSWLPHEMDAAGHSRIWLVSLALSLRQLPATGLGFVCHPVCLRWIDSRAKRRNGSFQSRPSGQPEALGKLLLDVDTSPERYEEYGRRARATYERRHGPSRNLEQLLDIYRFAIRQPVPARHA